MFIGFNDIYFQNVVCIGAISAQKCDTRWDLVCAPSRLLVAYGFSHRVLQKNENELTQRNEREEKIDAHVTFMQFEFMNFHSYTIDNL